MTKFYPDPDSFTSVSTAHLGHARRVSPGEWVAVDNDGQLVATIWVPYPNRSETFRCDPLPNACYLDAVEANDFSTVLDYALNNYISAP